MAGKGKQSDETTRQNHGNELDEDEYGYVDPQRKESAQLIQQLPSRDIDNLFSEELTDKDKSSRNLRRRDSQYRTLQLKNATLNSHHVNIGADKIYEILCSDPDVDEEQKIKTLREMHQSLTIKRQVKQRLDADKKRKIASKDLSFSTRCKLRISMAWHKFSHELKNISYLFEPWYSSIKTIQGQSGSGVASYFIFLRWILYINIWNFFITFCFVVIPQFLHQSISEQKSHYKNVTSASFSVSDLLTGSGWFTDSMFYFGHYSNEVIEVIPGIPYNMPLAYLLTIGVNALINLFAVSSSITASYRKNYVGTAGEIKNVFCNKMFSAWDYAIETENAALLQKRAFCNEMKEILYRKMQDQEKRTLKERIIQRTLLILVSLFCLAAIAGVGYLTYSLLQKKAWKVNVRILEDMTLSLTVTSIAAASYFLLKYSAKLELYISKRWKFYLTMIRVVVLRIVMLGIIVYFWMVIYKPPRNLKVCYETELGKEIYRLILVHFLMSLIFTLVLEYGRKLLNLYFPFIHLSQFDVAYNTLDLIYFQTLAWIAIFCVPLGSLMIIVILILLFYIKKSSLSANCRRPNKSWSIHEAHTLYLILTFVMYFFAAVTVGYSLFGTEPSICGPFRDYQRTGDIIRDIFIGKGDNIFSNIIRYLTSPGILFAVFCALGLVVYYMRAQARAHISVIKKIREQLLLASKDKSFLLDLFDSGFCAQLRKKSSSNNNRKVNDNASHQPQRGKNTPDGDSPHEVVFNEGYTDYSYRPVESPNHKKFVPGYIPANVPVNKVSSEESTSIYNNMSNNSARGDGLRSPLASVRRDSPHQIRKGSPYPSHEHGFRHFVSGDNHTPQ